MRKKWVWVWMSLALLSLMAGMLPGCGNTSITPTRMLVTADSGNNRVLVYNLPFSTNQAASLVLGQADFTGSTEKLTADGLISPYAVAADGSGNIYVGQTSVNGTNACRVTMFQPPFSNGMRASVVLGEPGFTTGACTTSATGLHSPEGLLSDISGNLWVSDFLDNRIVQFKPLFSNGMAANLVLGQTDFTSNSCNQGAGFVGPATASTICMPTGLVFDSQGNLWVADSGNSRVLQFRPPFSNAMTASLVLGQADFSGNRCNRSPAPAAPAAANTVCAPFGLAFDSQGNLWVTDYSNSRVLEYRPPFTSGMVASLVLGQANFSDRSAFTPPTSSTLWAPMSLAFDTSGRLFAVDIAANRTLVFAPPFSNNMAASLVIGQPDFASYLPNQGQGLGFAPTANTLFDPASVATR